MATSTSELSQDPDQWERHQYDFFWHDNPVPPALILYRCHQQDTTKANWNGPVAGTNGRIDERTERTMMGAGYAMGDGPIYILAFLAPLHQFDQKRLVSSKSCAVWHPTMTVKHPCSYLSTVWSESILRMWGRRDFHLNPTDVVHFDIISPLLVELHQWSGKITLVKIKSHN